jgi:hypothetical protein
MIELSVAEVLQAKCGRRLGFGDKAAPQEEQGGVAADLRVRTETEATRARGTRWFHGRSAQVHATAGG